MRYRCEESQVNWQKQTLAAVKGQIPEDSVHYHWLEKSGHEAVWLHEGDLTLDFLDLDWADAAAEPTLLLINGNLSVKGNILNENTEGAVGLMVFGNLQVEHVAVGGQEIYVSGDVEVAGVFCGSYNHGVTLVKGDLKAPVLINQDYTFVLEGERRCRYIFEDGGVFTPEGLEILKELFVEEAFYYDLFDKELAFGGIAAILQQGKCPLKDASVLFRSEG
jgi:hypothetical protein